MDLVFILIYNNIDQGQSQGPIKGLHVLNVMKYTKHGKKNGFISNLLDLM